MQQIPSKPSPFTHVDNLLSELGSGFEYVHQLLFFPDSGHDRTSKTRLLRNAFDRTIEAIPLLAGSLTCLEHESHAKLALVAPYRTAAELVTIHTPAHMDYVDIKAQHFPMKVAADKQLWPPDLREDGRSPAMQAQINFLPNGLILSARGSHTVFDGVGLLTIMTVWGAYCRGEDGSRYCGSDTLNREKLMHGIPTQLRDYPGFPVKLKDLPCCYELPVPQPEAKSKVTKTYRRLRGSLSRRMDSVTYCGLRIVSDLITYGRMRVARGPRKPIDEQDELQTEIFFFPTAKLRQLKDAITVKGRELAKSSIDEKDPAWVSTNDGLMSLLWCCITQAWKSTEYPDRDSNPDPWMRMRAQAALRVREPISICTFYINSRRYFQDPPLDAYIGNAILMSVLAGGFTSVDATLVSVTRNAYAARRRVDEVDHTTMSRMIGALASAPAVSRVGFRGPLFPESEMAINTWASQAWYAIDWGNVIGGRPERTRFDPEYSVPFALVLPKLDQADGWDEKDCGLEVAVHLKRRHLDALRKDRLFTQYAEWRCN